MKDLYIALHNVLSPQKLIEFVSTCISFGVKNIILSKVGGSAAQLGIGEAFKIAIKHDVKIIVLPDLYDIKAILPYPIYFIIQKEYASEEINIEEVYKNYVENKGLIFVFGGLEPGFSKKELELGKSFHVNLGNEVPTVALLSVTLYLLKNKFLKD
jgi:SpoU rRNA methylase family enzyme